MVFVLHEQASMWFEQVAYSGGCKFHVVKYETAKSVFECMYVCKYKGWTWKTFKPSPQLNHHEFSIEKTANMSASLAVMCTFVRMWWTAMPCSNCWTMVPCFKFLVPTLLTMQGGSTTCLFQIALSLPTVRVNDGKLIPLVIFGFGSKQKICI